MSGFESDVGINSIALDLMGVADDRGFSDRRMSADSALDFSGAYVVSRHDNYVVYAPRNPVIAVLVS